MSPGTGPRRTGWWALGGVRQEGEPLRFGSGRCEEWWVLVGRRQTEVGFEALGGGESFEGHEVEADIVLDDARHAYKL